MKFIGFRVSDNRHQALLEYCHSEGITVTECLIKLVDGLLSVEASAVKPIGVEGRLSALESMVEKLIKGEAALARDNSATVVKEDEMTKEEVAQIAEEVMQRRERAFIEAMVEAFSERMRDDKAELEEKIAKVVDDFSTRAKQIEEAHFKLTEMVSSLAEQIQNRKVHATAAEMLSCPDCGPFFVNAVKAASEELAKRAQVQAEAEAKPKRWAILSPTPIKGFTRPKYGDREWEEYDAHYYKETTDPAEVEEAKGKKGWKVIEIEAD